MKFKEVKEALIEMYACGPEVEHVLGLINSFKDADPDEEDIPTEDQVQKACDELVLEGVLQRAGREGFEATLGFMRERELIE